MRCGVCGTENVPHRTTCANCGASLGSAPDATLAPRPPASARLDSSIGADVTIPPRPARVADGDDRTNGRDTRPANLYGRAAPSTPPPEGEPIAVGHAFGHRYHVIRLLGMGGMGAVYQAWDEELGVAVAIKVIRPDPSADKATSEQTERRFKRELLLARQVTHKNVVRIHDLGEINGVKYITMPYIQGANLDSILRRDGRLTVARTLFLARQMAAGLAAAHDVGIVHRDLKPANVMVDPDDVAIIMDFGISQSVGTPAATASMAVVGTIAYMAPEQAMARAVDHRADIYAFGLILHDLLTGGREPGEGQSAISELMGRLQAAPPPISFVRQDVPQALVDIVEVCVQPDPGQRFQSTHELQRALEEVTLDGTVVPGKSLTIARKTALRTAQLTPASTPSSSSKRLWVGAAAATVLVAAAGGGWWVMAGRAVSGSVASASDGKVVSIAVLPFRNTSGDGSLNWLSTSLAEMIGAQLGDTRNLRVVSSDRLFQIFKDLRIAPENELDSQTERRLAEFSSADELVTGQYARFGAAIRLQASLKGKNRKVPVTVSQEASTEEAVPAAVAALVQALRDRLGQDGVSASAADTPAQPLSASVPALKAYSEGMSSVRSGNTLDAIPRFKVAVTEDPRFAMAYARLAQSYQGVGSSRDAEDAARKATDLADTVPPDQRFLIQALDAQIRRDMPHAIEAYERLAQASPNDSQVLVEVGMLYESTGAFDKAADSFNKVLKKDPNYSDVLYALGRVEIRRRNPQRALEYLNKGLTLAIQADNQQARGDLLNAIGIAYKRMNKPEDALRYYQEALDVRRRLDYKRGVAATLTELGQIQSDLQRSDEAVASLNEALAIRRENGDTQGVGNTLLELGRLAERREDYPRALDLFRESLQIQIDIGNENYQGLLLHNIGAMYQAQGRMDDASTYFQRALDIRNKSQVAVDIADTLHGLAETDQRTGRLDDALSHYLKALELRRSVNDRRGAARESAGMAAVFVLQGRYGAAVDASAEAVTSLRAEGDQLALSEALAGQARALISIGRIAPARTSSDEAYEIAKRLKSGPLSALALSATGDGYLQAGDIVAARAAFERAVQAAGRAPRPDIELRLRLNLARADVEEQKPGAVQKVKGVIERADSLALRPLSAEASLYLGRAAMAARDVTAARSAFENSVELANRMGYRLVSAEGHAALGTLMRKAGDQSGAGREFADARNLVESIKKDARTDDVMAGAELRRVVSAASAPAVAVTSR